MSVSNSPAFPTIENIEHNSDWRTELGMTYRQWLIGQITASMASSESWTNEGIVSCSFELADMIIKKLDGEG